MLAMIYYRSSVLAVALVIALGSSLLAAETTKEPLSTVKKAIDEKKAVLVDVREPREWNAGHVAGAISLPLSELQNPAAAARLKAKLPKDKILYTHCVVGKRALTAGKILEEHGYEVRCLKPGYKELLSAGFEKAKE